VVNVLPAVVVFGAGIAITVAPLTATAMSSAPAHLAGIASAVNNDLSRFGGLVFISGGLCAAGGLLAAVTITSSSSSRAPRSTS